MHLVVGIVALLGTVVAVTAAARRIGVPAPILLLLVGVLGSALPFIPEVRLTSEVVLIGLLPPLLYAAALQTSLIDIRAYARPILSLAVGLVIFTTLGVGVLVHTLLPEVGWPAAFAIGAVVAPPDAVAATAVARRIGLPRSIVTVLEGESLLNDATALVALKTALLATAAAVSIGGVTVDFLLAALGGTAAGVLVAAVVGGLRRHVQDPAIDVSLSMLTPFVAYVLAEEVHGSGVIGVVVAGLVLGHKAPVLQTASSRIAERLNWSTISFLLENVVFLLIGLQAEWILAEVRDSTVPLGQIAVLCLASLVAVVALRFVWLLASRAAVASRVGGRRPTFPLSYAVITSWAGMRGVVTLAAAFAIPEDTELREVLLAIALTVTAGTLLLHGLTLPWLVRRLDVPSPDPREDWLARAELLQRASRAGRERLAALDVGPQGAQEQVVRDLLDQRLEQRDFAAWERLGELADLEETPSELYVRLRLEMLAAERAAVLDVRASGEVPHEVVEGVLDTLDVEESMLSNSTRRRRGLAEESVGVASGSACDHLLAAPTEWEVTDRRCAACVAQGTHWVHLRVCLTCHVVACCDSSPERHATAHHHATGHPVIGSAEPGEHWRWCYLDERLG